MRAGIAGRGRAGDAPLSAGGSAALWRATVEDVYAYAATLVRDRGAAEDVGRGGRTRGCGSPRCPG